MATKKLNLKFLRYGVIKSCHASKRKVPPSLNDRLNPVIMELLKEDEAINPFISQNSFDSILDSFDKYNGNNLEKKEAIEMMNMKKKDKFNGILENC